MTRVYIVRHGAAPRQATHLNGRTPNVRLGQEGLRQAEAAAMRLAQVQLSAVHTSPLERARDTADIIARTAGLAPIVQPALNEIDFRDWSGASFASLEADPAWRRWNGDRGRARAPGGETMSEAQLRAVAWLEEAQRTAAGAVAAVSHGDLIKALVAHVLGLPLHFYSRFDIDPGSITIIDIETDGPRLHLLNDTTHVRLD